ncbi:cation:proton antiporter [Caminibacter mediatlanticus TB-2]|uniref:Cation:proton antiporter n=1 Tax=Caminibacter mediatlanticus TB-2 TaxID=391592 RepID=A0AAI9F231_9BACT|nr:cation:proton antiporter [Caminibacter mediatlanticus]EDM23374.1 Sodium/hydrogen exchanger [Caminibacter mediatlanticus TB-2]QCT93709.1 cation:proton antiporter [Caminibacter mediatlanticus TB-2]
MSAEIILMITLSVILLISPYISNALKLPISMVEILLGSIAASLHLLHENEMFKILAEVGFLYLMLLAGMEVNLKALIKLDKKIIKKGLMFLFLLYFLSILSVIVFKFSIIFIAILPLISIGLMLSIQQEIGKQPWLDLAITIGVIGELLSILVLTILSGYFGYGLSKELLLNIGILFGFLFILGIGFVLFRTLLWWYPNLKHSLMPVYDKYHQDVRIAMSLFFIMIAVMMILHLDVVLGAFVVGMFLTTFFDHNHNLEHKLAPFGFGFLITIFFVHVGSSIDLKAINFSLLRDALFISFLMIILRVISSFVFFKELKLKNTILFGFSLSMPLTLLIATATLAYQNKTIDSYWYTVLVLTSVVEVAIVMISVKVINKLKFQKKDSK